MCVKVIILVSYNINYKRRRAKNKTLAVFKDAKKFIV